MTAAPVSITPGFNRCFDPDCTAAPIATFLIISRGLQMDCGVCDGHVGGVNRLRGLGAELTNWSAA